MAHNDYEMAPLPEVASDSARAPKVSTHPATIIEDDAPLSLRSSITARERATILLHRSLWPVAIVVFYSALALTTWTLLCIMSKRPIRGQKSYYETRNYEARDVYLVNEKYIKFAHILRTITGLLTIPITSAICSMAAVGYMQNGPWRKTLTLKKLMALADQGWISRRVLKHLLDAGSFPFYLAFALTLFGSVSQIMQEAFISQESIKAATYYHRSAEIGDIPSMITQGTPLSGDVGIYQLRDMLNSATLKDYDAYLWRDDAGLYNPYDARSLKYVNSNFTGQPLSFVVDLPFNFSTGAGGTQYAPRINSSSTYFEITEAEFIAQCGNETGAEYNDIGTGDFRAAYSFSTTESGNYGYSVRVCMTGDKRISPWKPTRDRQDTSEELYLRLDGQSYHSKPPDFYKATVKSTLGYFEVPSQWNGNRPGPLLDKDPILEGSSQTKYLGIDKRDIVANISSPGNKTLMDTNAKGPLFALALALFGNDSFIESRTSHPEAYHRTRNDVGFSGCPGVSPLGFLGYGADCVTESDAQYQVYSWLSNIENSFFDNLPVAVFLANKQWLTSGSLNTYGKDQISVNYDPGIDTFKPKISQIGIIISSIFLGMHILGLVLLAVYTVVTRPWANEMGSEVMLKLGAYYAHELEGKDKKEWNRIVDQLPGFIGDASKDTSVGKMTMGADTPLKGDRKYEGL